MLERAWAAAELHGRADERRALREMLGRAARGRLRATFLDGEPGIGKSRLLAAVLRDAEADGFTTFLGRCDELARSLPFAPLIEAFDIRPHAGGDPGVAGLIAGGPATAAPAAVLEAGGQFRIVEALLDLLEHAATDGPVALALDDLQWADESTLLFLRAAGSRLADLPIALLGALRPWPVRPALERLAADLVDSGGLRVALGPLDARSVHAIAAELLDGEPGPELQRLLAATRGNPLYAVELARSLAEAGGLRASERGLDPAEPELPPTLRVMILRRLSSLSPAAVEALQKASILGSTFAMDDLAALLSAKPSELFARLAEVFRSELLEEHGDRLAFRHDLIREALYEDMPLSVRRALHREAAGALADAGASPLAAAEQFVLGAQPGDDEAIEWLRRAARQAASRAVPAAIRLLESAHELSERGTAVRGEIAGELAVLMVVAGRGADAEALGRELDAAARAPQVAASTKITLAEAFWNRGDIGAALELFEQCAGLPDEAEPHRSIAAAFSAQMLVLLGDLDGGRAAAERAREHCHASVRLEVEVIVLETLAVAAGAIGDFETGVGLAGAAERAAAAVDSEWAAYLYPQIYVSLELIEADRLEEARSAVLAGREACEAAGNVTWLPMLQWLHAASCFVGGEWADAVAEIEVGLELSEDLGNPFGAVFGLGMLALMAIHRGDPDEAERRLDEAERALAAAPGSGLGADWLLSGRALAAEARGADAEALGLLEAAWQLTEPLRYLLSFRTVAPALVRLAMREGREDLAAAVAEAVEAAPCRGRVPSVEAAALRCRGMAVRDGDAMLAAVEAYRRSPRRHDLALACEEAAAVLADRRRQREAVALLEEAVELHERLGAAHCAARATASLRALGVRRGVRGRRARPAGGWESLTATEQRVARLAAERLTNAEIGAQLFISKRTVQTHLKHIFAKLELNSRRDLSAHVPGR